MQDELATSIASDLGIADLPPEERETLIGRFGEIALMAATTAILEKLSEEKRGEFARLAAAGDAAALMAFLDREAPGHEDVAKAAVAEEVRRFRAAGTDEGSAAGVEDTDNGSTDK